MNEKRRACAPYQFFGAPWTANGTGQMPRIADIGRSLQSCGYSPSRSSQSSPCHVRCSSSLKCRK